MTVLTIVITLLGIGFLIALCAVGICVEAKYPQKKFDERQQADRNKGYRFGFWFGVGGQFAGMIAVLLLCRERQGDTAVLAAVEIGVMLLPFMAFTTYCAAKDALFAAWENPAATGIGFCSWPWHSFWRRILTGILIQRHPSSTVSYWEWDLCTWRQCILSACGGSAGSRTWV